MTYSELLYRSTDIGPTVTVPQDISNIANRTNNIGDDGNDLTESSDEGLDPSDGSGDETDDLDGSEVVGRSLPHGETENHVCS